MFICRNAEGVHKRNVGNSWFRDSAQQIVFKVREQKYGYALFFL